MLSKLAACGKKLATTRVPQQSQTVKTIRRLTTKFGPVNPSRYGSKGAKPMSTPDMRPKATPAGAGNAFDFTNLPIDQKVPPSGPISTQGLNRHSPPTSSKPNQPSPGQQAQQSTANKTTGQDSLKPKKLSRVADTDWFLVTTVADTKYFYNRKTGDTTSKLPASVEAHIGRVLTKVENETVAANAAPLPSDLSRDSLKTEAKKVNQTTSATSTSSKETTNTSSRAQSQASTFEGSSILQRLNDTTAGRLDPKAQANIDPNSFAPIPSSNRPVTDFPALSVRNRPLKVVGENEEGKVFEFTAEERRARLEALQEQYRQETGRDEVLELSDEELDDIMQDEANEALQEAEDPESIVPEYLSRVVPKKKKKSSANAAPKKLTKLEEMAQTSAQLFEMAERFFEKGRYQDVVQNFTNFLARLEESVSKGVVLNLREQSAYLGGKLVLLRAHNALRQWALADAAEQKMKALNPDHPFTLIAAALQALALQKYPEAVKGLNAVLDIDPNNVMVMHLLAEIYMDLNDPMTAEQIASDIMTLEKKNYKAMLLRARAWALLNDFLEADKYVQKAILVDGKRPEAYVIEARLLLQVEKFEEGMGAIRQALELNPAYVPAYTLLGNAFLEKGMLDDAEKAFKVAVEQDANNIESLIGLGVLAYNQENWPRLLEISSKAVSIDSNAIEAWFHRARAELELKHFQLAITSFETCISLDPDPEEPYLYLASALHAAGRTAECIARMDHVLTKYPQSVKARVHKAFALHSMGKYDEAMVLFDQAIALDPLDNEAKIGRVSLLMSLGKNDEAATYYNTFKSEDTEEAMQAAMKIANQSHASDQARDNAGDATEAQTEENALEHDAIQATQLTEDAMKWAPTMEELGSLSSQQIQDAMNETPPNISTEDMMSELHSEIARVNKVLGKIGLPQLDPTGQPPSGDDPDISQFRTSDVSEEDLKEYAELLQGLKQKAANAPPINPKTPDEFEAFDALGLNPEILQQMKDLTEKDHTAELDDKERQIYAEEGSKLMDWTRRTVTSLKSQEATKKKIKKGDNSL